MIQTTSHRTTRIRYRATASGAWTEILEGIESNSLDIDDLLSNSLFGFGSLCASKFECRLYQDIDLTGKEIYVDVYTDTTLTPVFHGFVESSKQDNTHTYRTIVAYDDSKSIKDTDISAWWESYWANRASATLQAVITAMCQQIGYTADFTLATGSAKGQNIGHSIDLSEARMTFEQMLLYLCELSVLHCHCKADDSKTIVFRTLSVASPASIVGIYDKQNTAFEDYNTDAIGRIIFYQDGSTRVEQGTADTNPLLIQDNPLLYDRTDAQVRAIGTAMLNDLATLSVRPANVEMVISAPDLLLGDCVSSEYGNTVIMHKRIYGVQLFSQDFNCEAEKKNDLPIYYNPEIRRLYGRLGEAEATLDVMDDRIESKVSQTTYTQGINAINARVDTTNGNVTALGGRVDTAESDISTLDGRLDTAEGSISTLGTNVNGLSSRMTTAESNITQNATAISQRVTTSTYNANKTATDNRIASAEGRLTTAEADISSAETSIGTLGTRLTSAESSITQNAHDITLKVSSSDYNGQTIASKINQSASTVQIEAGHINLNGVVTANNYFKINTDGTFDAVAGHIGGWNVGSDSIFSNSPSIGGKQYYVTLNNYTENTQPTDGAIFAYSNEGGVLDFPFVLSWNGKLTAKNAEIIGNITANTGAIGGWSIQNGKLTATANAFVPFTMADLETARQITLGTLTPTAQQIQWYDFDRNGIIDIQDMLVIKRYINGQYSIDYIESQYPNYTRSLFPVTVEISPSDMKTIKYTSTAYGRTYEAIYGLEETKATKGEYNEVNSSAFYTNLDRNTYHADASIVDNVIELHDYDNNTALKLSPNDVNLNGTSPVTKNAVTSLDSRIIIDGGGYVRFGSMVQVAIKYHSTQNISGVPVFICNLPQPVVPQGVFGFNGDTGAYVSNIFYWFNGTLYTQPSETNIVANTHYSIVFSYISA